MHIFLNADVDGNITEAIVGDTIIPDKEYEFFFESDFYIDDFDNYKVVRNGKHGSLVTKEGATNILSS